MNVDVFLQVDFSNIFNDASLLSSIAIILGAVFVVFQLRHDTQLIQASERQAEAAAIQAKLSTEQLKQNNELANMDMVMRIYEFANTAEVQSSWVDVLNSKISSFEQFEKLSKSEQIPFFQIAALFESLGVLVDRKYVKLNIIADMFAAQLAWDRLKPFLVGMKEKYGDEDTYVFFEKLYEQLTSGSQITAAG